MSDQLPRTVDEAIAAQRSGRRLRYLHWGIGLTADDERAASPATWQGLNLLGFALMAARDALTP
jgi:predicted NAD-dependent protein-ADP-ribosyltransferase YbiA (DUF1768 family)